MKRVALLVTLALVTACSGGGGTKTTPSSLGNAANLVAFGGKTVLVAIKVPAGLGRAVFSVPGPGQSRSLQYTSPSVKSAVALQLCSQSETNSGSQDGVTSCKSGSVFDIVYDVTNPAICPNYNATQAFSCTLRFPAGLSSGSQWELDLYDQLPRGGTNGVGGVLPIGATSVTLGTGDGAVKAFLCVVATSACLLGAGLSDPRNPVTGSGPANPISISQIEGFIQRGISSLDTAAQIASYAGSGGPGTAVSGVVGSFILDAGGNTITGGSCIQDAGNEYANAFSPAADQAPGTTPGNGFNQIAANVGGSGYHRDNGAAIAATTGLSPTYGAFLAAFESYSITGLGTNPLLLATWLPCFVGYAGPASGLSFNVGIGVGAASANIDFPADSVTIQFDGTNAVPNANQVGRVGSVLAPEDGAALLRPYYAAVGGGSIDYVGYEFLGGTNCVAGSAAPCGAGPPGATVGTSNSHNLGEGAGVFAQSPLWGEVGNFRSGCPRTIPVSNVRLPLATMNCGATAPFASNNARFTQNPGTPPFTAGRYVPVVNMQGSNSQATVFGLQAILPTGGVYSAMIPSGPPNPNDANGGCDGVVNGSSSPTTTGSFVVGSIAARNNSTIRSFPVPNGGASWLFTAPANPNTPNAACTVTFTDGFNIFTVIFTNTGAQNPLATPGPTPSPTPPGFGGPSTASSPQI